MYEMPWNENDKVRMAQSNLYANAYNAAVNYGSDRADKKMRHLIEAINDYERVVGRAKLDYLVSQGVITNFKACHPTECHMRPGGLYHQANCENDGNSEVAKQRAASTREKLPERFYWASRPSLVG